LFRDELREWPDIVLDAGCFQRNQVGTVVVDADDWKGCPRWLQFEVVLSGIKLLLGSG